MAEIHAARRGRAQEKISARRRRGADHLRPQRPLPHRPGQLQRRAAAARRQRGGAGDRLAVHAGRRAGLPRPGAHHRALHRAAAGCGDGQARPGHGGIRGARDDGRTPRRARGQGRGRETHSVRPENRGAAGGQGSVRDRAARDRMPDQQPGHRRRDLRGPDRSDHLDQARTGSTERDSPCAPPGSAKPALSPTRHRSHARASPHPPPTAGPFTAAIVGSSGSSSCCRTSTSSRVRVSTRARTAASGPNSPRSAPAQNAGPSPVSTQRRERAGRPATRASGRAVPAAASVDSALRRAGRSSTQLDHAVALGAADSGGHGRHPCRSGHTFGDDLVLSSSSAARPGRARAARRYRTRVALARPTSRSSDHARRHVIRRTRHHERLGQSGVRDACGGAVDTQPGVERLASPRPPTRRPGRRFQVRPSRGLPTHERQLSAGVRARPRHGRGDRDVDPVDQPQRRRHHRAGGDRRRRGRTARRSGRCAKRRVRVRRQVARRDQAVRELARDGRIFGPTPATTIDAGGVRTGYVSLATAPGR